MTDGDLVEPSLLNLRDGIAYLEVTISTGYTQRLPKGLDLGIAVEATVIPEGPKGCDDVIPSVENELETP